MENVDLNNIYNLKLNYLVMKEKYSIMEIGNENFWYGKGALIGDYEEVKSSDDFYFYMEKQEKNVFLAKEFFTNIPVTILAKSSENEAKNPTFRINNPLLVVLENDKRPITDNVYNLSLFDGYLTKRESAEVKDEEFLKYKNTAYENQAQYRQKIININTKYNSIENEVKQKIKALNNK